DLAAPPLLDPRNADAQLARPQDRLGVARVDRAGDADRPHEAPERPLGQVKLGFALRARRRLLPAGDDDRLACEDDPDGLERDPRQIHHDFDGLVGFDDVARRAALDRRVAGRQPLDEAIEQAADVVAELAAFEKNGWHHGVFYRGRESWTSALRRRSP